MSYNFTLIKYIYRLLAFTFHSTSCQLFIKRITVYSFEKTET